MMAHKANPTVEKHDHENIIKTSMVWATALQFGSELWLALEKAMPDDSQSVR